MISLGVGFIVWKHNSKAPAITTNQKDEIFTDDVTVIRTFMANPNLELSFVKTDLPMPYFRVGKVTKVGNGESMEAVEDWVRKVNIYDQKGILDGRCATYEYQLDARSHKLTSVDIRGLRPNEIEALKKDGINCVDSYQMPKISKADAETIAKGYLKRAVPNLDQIWEEFIYSLQSNGELHQWLWEDKGYKLPEGLEGRPYSYPIIRITVYGNKQIQYWNTVSLFQN
ncbi:hypothetical protein GYA19_01265 [Candidatus Beckwithbacteria bacterium]|nr:hypothetical protein [Candidatus Beckwithbacteria bacterium]